MIYKSQYRLSEAEPSEDVAKTLLGKGRKYGSKAALINSATGKTYTYTEVERVVRKLAQGLHEGQGLRKGDIILMIGPNCPEYTLLMLAALSLGIIVSTANPLYTIGETVHHLSDCGAKFVVTSPEMAPKILDACAKYGKARGVMVFGEAPGCIPYASLLRYTGDRVPNVLIDVKHDIALLPYSSGTTGRPKGVMLTHYNVLYNLLQCSHPEIGIFANPGQERALMFLPMYHMFGIVVMFTSVREGNTLIVMPKYDLQTFVRDIRHYKPTYLPVVPPTMVQLTKSSEVNAKDLSSVKTVLYGAAPLGSELEKEWDEKFPQQRRGQGYGLTELVAAATITPKQGFQPYGSCGVLVPMIEARIIDTETGRDVAAGDVGEIWVRGGNVMKGYYGKPEQTRNTIDANKWLHTGDIGHFDQDGFCYVVDRKKELIKYKGSQVAPAELESVLLGHPAIADTAVVGIPDQAAGELPRAYVVLKPKQQATAQDIQAFMKEHAAPYKQLRGGIKFVDAVPKSPSGKILRRVIREQIKEEMALKAKL